MSTTSNVEQGALMPQWPHDQLTHLATHTPVPATRGVENTSGVVGNGGIGATFSASTALNFPLPQNPAPFASAGYPHSELFRQLPPVFHNNNTKLDPETPLNAEVIKAELLARPNDLWTQMAALVNQNQRPHSALNNAELAAVQPANPEVHAIMHHPLLSPGPRQSAIQRTAKEEPAQEEVQPPIVPELPRQAPSIVVSETSNDQETAPPNEANLNNEEQARLLLAVSQNLSGIGHAEIESGSGSPPPAAQSNGRPNNPPKSRTFFRPPGHVAPTTANDEGGWTCPICGFGCSSKFHYNSHMNTHGCHRCTICNYTSRTEGRLKKHMLDSHTAEQRQEVGALNGEQPAVPTEGGQPNRPEEGGSSNTRLPSALEQIRALADNGGVVPHEDPNGEDSNLTAASNEMAAPPPHSTPVKRSGGKPKKYECKQCKHISTTKEDSWIHNRIHIPFEKQMRCDQCPFITEYRHHLIYHQRGHSGAKPFKCSKCEYTCVNKSMLNSHMKSHTPVYQFRCQDCTYQTKYCHSLKMHTVKYNHRRVRGQVTSTGEENAESVDENLDGMETESMKNYDIPADDLEALERHQHGHQSQSGQMGNDHQSAAPPAAQSNGRELPPSTGTPLQLTPRLNALLQPPITASGNIQQFHQFLLHQQQLGRMHEPLIHGFVPRPKCDMCEFTANNQEELFAHKLNHIALGHHHQANQQPQRQPMNLYGGLGANPLLLQPQHNPFQELAAQLRNGIALRAQQSQAAPPSSLASVHLHSGAPMGKTDVNENHEQKTDGRAAETPEASGATTNTTASTPRVGMHDAYGEEHMSGSSETHEEAGETSSSPSDSHKSMDAGSSSPHSSAHSSGHVGAKKRKAHKLELISQRLQGKNSPDNTDEHHSGNEHGDEKRRSPDSAKMNGALAQPIPLGPLQNGVPNHQLNSLIAQFSNDIQERRASTMPYTCQHCVMAFQDQALYQIHLGFHGYELPFKCNRCGHNANTALDFNLHLYQEKH